MAEQISAPQWRVTSDPPVEPSRFGADHWSTFGYVETRTVDHRGTLEHAHMRCHGARHPVMLNAKVCGSFDARDFPTQLADEQTLPDHDDYDCLDDLIAAGLLEVHMPRLVDEHPADGHPIDPIFVDAYGKAIGTNGYLIDPAHVTGLDELHLCVHATFSLTDAGRQVAGALRAHKASGGAFATFRIG